MGAVTVKEPLASRTGTARGGAGEPTYRVGRSRLRRWEVLKLYLRALHQSVLTALVIGFQYGKTDEGFRSFVRTASGGWIDIRELPQNQAANCGILLWHWLTCSGAMFTGFIYELVTKRDEVFASVEENKDVLLVLLNRRKRKEWWRF